MCVFVVVFSPLCRVRLRENRENLAWDAFDKSLFKDRKAFKQLDRRSTRVLCRLATSFD